MFPERTKTSLDSGKSSLPALDVHLFYRYLLTNPWRTLFIILCLIMLPCMIWMSQSAGTTYDEWMDSNNGMLTLKNIISFGKNHDFINFWHGYLYPQFFYIIVGTLYGLFFDSVWNMAHEGLHQAKNHIAFYTAPRLNKVQKM